MPRTARPALRGRLLRAAAACAVLLALAGYLLVHYLTSGGPGAPRCVVRAADSDSASYELKPEQAVNAATIEAVASSRGLPERAVTIALATAMQESALRNINHGDRDSVGLFQQRPTQGWGTAQQILDPVYAAGKFYEHLEQVPGYSRLPLTVAAQKVQRSGFPQAYAKHEPEAALLASALTGRAGAALSCTTSPEDGTPGDPVQVRKKLRREFGANVLEGADEERRGGSGKGRSGSLVAVRVPAADTPGGSPERRGWELAHWAVAHASELRIAEVSYAGRVWSSASAGNEWHRTDESGGAEKEQSREEVLITTAQ